MRQARKERRARARIRESLLCLLGTAVLTAIVLWGVDYYRGEDPEAAHQREMRNLDLMWFDLLRKGVEAPCDINTTLYRGKPVADLIARFQSGSEQERLSVLCDLGMVYEGYAGLVFSSMRERPSIEARRMLLSLVEGGLVSQRAAVVLPTFIAALKDPSKRVRMYAAWHLGDMYAPALPACAALRDCLKDPDVETRFAAAHALRDIRFEIAGLIEVSADVVRNDPDPRNRERAVCNLAGMLDAPAIKALESALADTDEQVRSRAEQYLGAARWRLASSDRQRR